MKDICNECEPRVDKQIGRRGRVEGQASAEEAGAWTAASFFSLRWRSTSARMMANTSEPRYYPTKPPKRALRPTVLLTTGPPDHACDDAR